MSEHEKFTDVFPGLGDIGPVTRSWCRLCGAPWPCAPSEVHRLTALAESQGLVIAQMREALEHVLTESEWVKKRNEWSNHGQTVGMQPTADRACQEIHFIARQALAQPADAAAALAGAVLEAADAIAQHEEESWQRRHGEACWCDRSKFEEDVCLNPRPQGLVDYRRARSALRGDGEPQT